MATPEHTPPSGDPRIPPPFPYGQQGPYGGAPYGGQGPYGGPMPGGPGGMPPMPPMAPPSTGGGLGTAALVFGICGLVLLPLCGLGVLFAIVGFILGIAGIAKNSNKGQAVGGLVLSVFTLVLALVLVLFLYYYLKVSGLDACFADEAIASDSERLRQCMDHVLRRRSY